MTNSHIYEPWGQREMRRRILLKVGACVLLQCLWVPATVLAQLPAFPGAVGQGAAAVGGRGGDLYHITSLDDYDPDREAKLTGTLRHAIRSAEGPRTIVFDISGVIQLHAPLKIIKNNLTIAGQTSPGGITLCGYPLEISRSHDIVIRHLRVRTGDFHARPSPEERPSVRQLDPSSANAVNVGDGCDRVILDHLSTSWSIDETLSVAKCRDVTVQHCIIAESLNRSFHPKGPHGYGSLLRGELTLADQQAAQGGFTFMGNLWAHHRARNPSIGGAQSIPAGMTEQLRRRTDVNLVNNVIYNWGDAATHRSQNGDVRINLIGNYYVSGPATSSNYIFREGDRGKTELYQRDNYHDADEDSDHDGQPVDHSTNSSAFMRFDAADRLVGEDSPPLAFLKDVAKEVRPAQDAYHRVLQLAGACLWRDAIDKRILMALVRRQGALLNSQESLRNPKGILAGIDDVPVVRRDADFDTDADGMPDDFEAKNGLNPHNSKDRNDTELSREGYTNLEVYLAACSQCETGSPAKSTPGNQP